MKFSSKKILELLLSLTIFISLAASCTQSDNPEDGKEKETDSLEMESANGIKSSDVEVDSLETESTNGIQSSDNEADYLPDITKPIFPRSNVISKDVDTLNYDQLPSKGHKLAAVSLQGLVNRSKPCIFLPTYAGNGTAWELDYLLEKGYVENVTSYGTDLLKLIEKYKDFISGAVVYDPAKLFTVNTATNIAGIQGRMIVSPDMLDNVKALGITDILDIRDMNFNSVSEAYAWELENCLPLQSKDVLSISYYSAQCDYGRDYLIANSVHTFWITGENDPEYDPELRGMVEDMLSKQKPNIPCIGFWQSWTDTNEGRGVSEYTGVKLAGLRGKFTNVSDWSGNYSFNSGVPVDETKYKQREKAFREYDPDAKYVAFVMMEGGDSPGYMQTAFPNFQWNDPARGKVPMNIGVSMALRYLAPAILEMMYENMTENDYFFTSISGIGYCYPLEGYGSYGAAGVDEEQILSEYFEWTAQQMEDLDIKMMGLYSHPRSPWNYEQDDGILNKYVVVQPQIQAIIADMDRNEGPTVSNSDRFLENETTIHHTLTRGPSTEVGNSYQTLELDQAAADDLASQIRTFGANRQFTTAAFASFNYGPTRLAMIAKQLEDEGYIFVTLDEYDYLFRQAALTNPPSAQLEKTGTAYEADMNSTEGWEITVSTEDGAFTAEDGKYTMAINQITRPIEIDLARNPVFSITVDEMNPPQLFVRLQVPGLAAQPGYDIGYVGFEALGLNGVSTFDINEELRQQGFFDDNEKGVQNCILNIWAFAMEKAVISDIRIDYYE